MQRYGHKHRGKNIYSQIFRAAIEKRETEKWMKKNVLGRNWEGGMFWSNLQQRLADPTSISIILLRYFQLQVSLFS